MLLMLCAVILVFPPVDSNAFTFPGRPGCFSRESWLPVSGDTAEVELHDKLWTTEELKAMLVRESEGAIIEGTSWQRRKNAKVAMLCSFLVPGLGQFYNERPVKAMLVLGVETFYITKILENHRKAQRRERERDRFPADSPFWYKENIWVEEYKERTIDWIWWTAGAMVVIVLDAYVDAHLFDMRFGIEGQTAGEDAGLVFVLRF